MIRRRITAFAGPMVVVAAMVSIASSDARAHALDPGFLDIREIGSETYSVGWKVPLAGAGPMRIAALLPAACAEREPPALAYIGSAFHARWVTACSGGIPGNEIRIMGLEQTSTDVLVRFAPMAGAAQTIRLTPDRPAQLISRDPDRWEVVRTYTVLGIHHILTGIDHILFVLALILLVGLSWRLVKTITAFTLAHSITLSAAALALVSVPQAPIEAAIALSILFLAHELAVRYPAHPRLAERKPWLVAFAFGLLHGFGFAGALAETGLPQNEIPMALLTFNLGVEIGQLIFVSAALITIVALRRLSTANSLQVLPQFASRAGIYAIGGLSAFWLFERVASF